MKFQPLGMVGYGEVGRTFAAGLRPALALVGAWDLKFAQPEHWATARAYGVEDHMIPTLAETFPSIDWQKQGAY